MRADSQPPQPTRSPWPLVWMLLVPVGVLWGGWRLWCWWLMQQDFVLPD